MEKNELNHAIQELPDGGTRVQVLKINTIARRLILFNSYLPAEGSHDKECHYTSILDEIHEIIEKYSTDNMVIWAGDINASLRPRKRPTKNDKLFQDFCQQTSIESLIASSTDQPYNHFNGTSSSQIDHIMSLTSQEKSIYHVRVDKAICTNVSSHRAIIAETSLEILKEKGPTKTPTQVIKPKPKWNTVDTAEFKEIKLLTNSLKPL